MLYLLYELRKSGKNKKKIKIIKEKKTTVRTNLLHEFSPYGRQG